MRIFQEKGFVMLVFAKKIGTTHFYDKENRHTVVTVLELIKTKVKGFRKQEKDGYDALILEGETAKNNHKIRERRIPADKIGEYKEGQELDISMFNEGDRLEIEGRSKGKGFAGVVKRHGFATGPKTHGSHNYRQPGSIGSTYPQRTVKGRKMAGRMGQDKITLRNVKVERIEKEKGRIWVKGHIPGAPKSLVFIKK